MYEIYEVFAMQGKITFKILDLETGEKESLTVGKEFLPPFVSPDSQGHVLDGDEYDALFEMSLVTNAVSKALSALSYGNLSRRALIFKLTSKHKLEREYAEAAADYAVRHRYIDEESQAVRIAHQCVRIKKQGKRKAAAYLMSKGYEKETVTKAVCSVDEAEYENAALCALLKKTDRLPDSKEERLKLINALLRQGHSKSHVEKAFRSLESGE